MDGEGKEEEDKKCKYGSYSTNGESWREHPELKDSWALDEEFSLRFGEGF